MQNKNSFQLYTDWINTFEELDDEHAGLLIKHIFRYVNDQDPETNDPIVRAVFPIMKQVLKRDLKKWIALRDRNRENGAQGGRPKTQNNPVGSVGSEEKPKKPVIVIDTVTVTELSKKESKYAPPSFDEFKKYGLSKKPDVGFIDLKLKYDSWIENGWKDGNDKPIKKWKVKLLHTLPYLNVDKKKALPNTTQMMDTSGKSKEEKHADLLETIERQEREKERIRKLKKEQEDD